MILQPQIQPTVDSTNNRSRSAVLFTTEKNSPLSGTTQFKPRMFKGQLLLVYAVFLCE